MPRSAPPTGTLVGTVDVTSIVQALSRIEEQLADARFATDMLRDGDVTAVADLDTAIDAMAVEIGELKSRTSGGPGS